ncbi:hypothetical protein [Nannocystis pusilla]|uniref:hypothetical protein n=1 Tax=Nannocystis pusilla TaxID=889268 RepID=UPI003DA44636
MTQIEAADLAPYVCGQSSGCAAARADGSLLIVGLLAGLALGRWWRREAAGAAGSPGPR